MAQLLTCPNRHHWDLTENPFTVLPLTRGLCPVCGEPPVADSPIDWEKGTWQDLVIVLMVLAVVGVFLFSGVLLASHGHDVGGWPCISAGLVLVLGACLCGWLQQRRRRAAVKAAANALAFAFIPKVLRSQAQGLRLPPFLLRPWLLVDRGCGMLGRYQGSQVLLLDAVFRTPPDGRLTLQTVVVFPEPVPGLPDFQLEPWRDESRFRNRSLEQLLGMHPLNPLLDEPFGRHYRLGLGVASAVRPWLSPPLYDFLVQNKGWILGTWQGRFYLYRPRRCRGDACATFIAVAWRLRQMLRLSIT